MEEENDISILNLIEKNISKIKASHNPLKKASYIAVVEKLCEAYQEQLNAELINTSVSDKHIKVNTRLDGKEIN
ncbi:hypothetical protein [Lactobacillus gasseri]|uniref:hypothetical protein n=1 Tax=Lactobacillus gasseri TaxID=1596 RepID=UPI00237D9641|nr:hypothetical protein [Lactobacillus gasseri]